jgi:hypothetical protein
MACLRLGRRGLKAILIGSSPALLVSDSLSSSLLGPGLVGAAYALWTPLWEEGGAIKEGGGE